MPDLLTMLAIENGDNDTGLRLSPEEVWKTIQEDEPSAVAIDTESPSFYWQDDDAIPYAVTLGWRAKNGELKAYYVDCFGHDNVVATVEMLRKIFGFVKNLVCHNLKYDLHVFNRLFVEAGEALVAQNMHCTILMDYCLNEFRNHGLKPLGKELEIPGFGGKDADEYKAILDAYLDQQEKATGVRPAFNEVPPFIMDPYAVNDAWLTIQLFELLQEEMQLQDRQTGDRADVRSIYELEIKTMWAVWSMEERGMRVDMDFVFDKIAELTPQIEEIRVQTRDLVGWDVNPQATEDIAKVLTELGVDTSAWINPRTRRHKLPEWVLSDLIQTHQDEVVRTTCRRVLEFREHSKMLSSYYQALVRLTKKDETGASIVRCNVKQHGARTGRSSVTDPALQTIPRTKGGVRGAFIAREGHSLVFADYSQQELRVLAHFMKLMGDDSMYDIYVENGDLHWETAEAVFEKPRSELTKDHRDRSKSTNFGVVYGMGAKKAAATIGGGDLERGKEFLVRYNRRFPGLGILKKNAEARLAQRGFIVTPFGRRHRETNRRFAYKAINSLVQGTSADLTKAATSRIHDAFIANSLASQVVLTIHDEIICECPDDEIDAAKTIIRESMIYGFEDVLNVPLDIDMAVAKRWSDAKG